MSVIVGNNNTNAESRMSAGAPQLAGDPGNTKFKTNAEIFKSKAREGSSVQSSPFMKKSKLNQSGEVSINKDSGKDFTKNIGNQIVQANPNRSIQFELELNQRYPNRSKDVSQLQLKQEASFGPAAGSASPYRQKLDQYGRTGVIAAGSGGNVRSASQPGFATMPTNMSGGAAGFPLYRGAADGYKGSAAGGNSSGAAEPAGNAGDGYFTGQRSSFPGYQGQSAISQGQDASASFNNRSFNMDMGHQLAGSKPELASGAHQAQVGDFNYPGAVGANDDGLDSLSEIGDGNDQMSSPNLKQRGIPKQGNNHQNILQNVNQVNELVQNKMSRINKAKDKLDNQRGPADNEQRNSTSPSKPKPQGNKASQLKGQRQQDQEGDTYQWTNNSDPNQNGNNQDNNSQQNQQRRSSDGQSMRSRGSIRSSTNISVINYNNATINMNFNESNVEVPKDQNQMMAQQQHRDPGLSQQEGFIQKINNAALVDHNFAEARQSHPQQYPNRKERDGKDQKNLSKFPPNSMQYQNNMQMNGSQINNAYSDAVDPAQHAAVGQHRNSNSAMFNVEQRPGLLASSHKDTAHQSSASMGNNQNQHGQSAAQVFSGGKNSSSAVSMPNGIQNTQRPIQIQKLGNVNYNLINDKSPSQLAQQNLHGSFGKSANSLPNNVYVPINPQGQVSGSFQIGRSAADHSPPPHAGSRNAQSFGGSTGQFKSPGGTSLNHQENVNIDQLKSGLKQLNQQVQQQQQQLLLQNQQLQKGPADMSQQQMLEILKQYQNAQIDNDDKLNKRANRFEGQKDGSRKAGDDPYGMKHRKGDYSPSPNNGQRPRSSSRKIIKKIVKKKSEHNLSDINAEVKNVYEVTTIKIGRDGQKTFEKVEKMNQQPDACKDLKNSMKMLDQIKRSSSTVNLEHINDKNQLISQTRSRLIGFNATAESKKTELTNYSKASGAGILSAIMNPKYVASVQTIQVGNNSSNVYVQTVDNEKQERKLKKKIIIIQKKRRADGSVECARKEIYKDYGDQYAKRESRRLNSALDYYQGSAKLLEQVKKENPAGVQVNADGSINLNSINKSDRNEQRLKKQKENMFNQRQNISESLGTRSAENRSPNLQEQKNAQIMKNAQQKRPATALDRKDGTRKSVSSVLKKQEQQKGTKISKGMDKGVHSEYQDPQLKNKATINKGNKQNSAGKLGKRSDNKESTSNDTKLPNDTFDLQPKANPSNMMSTLIESNNGTTHKKYNKRKDDQEFQQNAVNLAYKAEKGQDKDGDNDEAQQDTDEQNNDVQQVKNIFARDQSDEDSIAPNFDKDQDTKNKKKNIKDRALEMTRDSKSTRKNRQQKKGKSGGTQNQEANEEDEKAPSQSPQQNKESKSAQKSGNQGQMSPTSLSTNLYTFKLPPFDASVYIQFIDQLIFGQKRKDAIMQPIPPAVGQLKFSITRNKSGMNKLTPSYYLNLEKNNGGKILILYGKKMAFKKQSYYLISLEKNKKRTGEKEAETCLGKLRACDGDQDKFVLYDAGENYNQKGVQFKDLRKEHGAFIYRYEPCNVGNIRKMTILYPAITCLRLHPKNGSEDAMTNDPQYSLNLYHHNNRHQRNGRPQASGDSADYDPNDRQDGYNMSTQNQEYSVAATSQHQKALGVKGTKDNHGREIPDGGKYYYSYVDWRPTSEQDTLVYNYENGERGKNVKYKTFVDNPPQWNPKTNTYVYDFKGRVTEPSIKNFQLIPEIDGRRGDTLQDFVLQFGKRDKDEFILDIQFPISIFQGFGLALSAFDTD